MYSSEELFQWSWKGYFDVYYQHQNNPQVSAETVHHESTSRYLHIFPISHPLGFLSADDITIDCWWHHND